MQEENVKSRNPITPMPNKPQDSTDVNVNRFDQNGSDKVTEGTYENTRTNSSQNKTHLIIK